MSACSAFSVGATIENETIGAAERARRRPGRLTVGSPGAPSWHPQPHGIPRLHEPDAAELTDVRAPAAAVPPLREDHQLPDREFGPALEQRLEDQPGPLAELRFPGLERGAIEPRPPDLRPVELSEQA